MPADPNAAVKTEPPEEETAPSVTVDAPSGAVDAPSGSVNVKTEADAELAPPQRNRQARYKCRKFENIFFAIFYNGISFIFKK